MGDFQSVSGVRKGTLPRPAGRGNPGRWRGIVDEVRKKCGKIGFLVKARHKKKMVLFDIDGTLLDTHGFGREAFIRGLARMTGERDELEYVSFAGNTDRNVLDQVMAQRKLHLGEEDIRRIFACIAEELKGLLQANPGQEIKGARGLLEALAGKGAALGLVTGNIRECAFLKLGSVGFDRFFGFGGFGDQHAERSKIAQSALAEASEIGIMPEVSEICLIGDTPFDVAAGLAIGVPVIGVATGKYGEDDLLKSGATLTVANYSDLKRLLDWLGYG